MNKTITSSILLIALSIIAIPLESKAITVDEISKAIGFFYSNNPENATISPAVSNNVMTTFGIGGGKGLTLGSENQPLSLSNLMDFTGLSQLDKVGLPKSSDGRTTGNTDSLLRALTANYSAATASTSKTQVDDSAKIVQQVASSISSVINTEEIDPQSSLEMLRKMGQELQATGQMLQSSAALQVAQAKMDFNRYNLEAANMQQSYYKDLQEKRYIESASSAQARLQERLLNRFFGEAAPNVASPIVANASIFGQ